MKDTAPEKLASLKHQLTDRVKLLQKVVLVHQGKVLLLKRSSSAKHRPGSWDLPGGNSEWPVNRKNSGFGLQKLDAIREVEEETGIKLATQDLQHKNLVYADTFFDNDKQVFSIILGWRVELPEYFSPNSVEISHEHTELAWVSFGAVEKYDFGGDVGQFVKDIIRGRGQSGN